MVLQLVKVALLIGHALCVAGKEYVPSFDGVISRPCGHLHIAISSVVHYAVPRTRLLKSMRVANVPMEQVHVFLGGTKENLFPSEWRGSDGTNYYAVSHNSIDFTAMIHIVENPRLFLDVRTWIYLHDTTYVGPTFWSKMAMYCNGIRSCAVPLTRSEASCNLGLYDTRFLMNQSGILALKKNTNNETVRFKRLNVLWEDALFHNCDVQRGMTPQGTCAKAWRVNRLCASESHAVCPTITKSRKMIRVYGNASAPRVAFEFSCIDLVKYTANIMGSRARMVLVP
jgi:hypothetical protein